LNSGEFRFHPVLNCFDQSSTFPYFDYLSGFDTAFGKSYYIGSDKKNNTKLDVFYTDPFIQPALIEDSIRLATIEEIIAMKIDVIQRGGRKKDFWDLHALFDSYNLAQMLQLHKKRYPYSHDKELILQIYFYTCVCKLFYICL
jgi:hypothetical protein